MTKRWPPQRFYTWQDERGHRHVLVARSLRQARAQLLLREGYVFKLLAKNYFTYRSFQKHDLIMLTKQLATLLKAGLAIIDSLDLLANQTTLIAWQWLLNDLKQQIITGQSLSQALARHTNLFSAIYIQIIATGELTGQLDESFAILALQLERAQTLHKRVKKALRYPLFLLVVAIFVTLIMLLIVLPKFAAIYRSFEAELPLLTQLIIALSVWLQQYGFSLCLIMLLGYCGYRYALKPAYNLTIARAILDLPIIGTIQQTACLTLIFQTLFITQRSGISLLVAIASAQKVCDNLVFRLSLTHIIAMINRGYTFSQAISDYPRLYPNLCYQLIHVGEESGTLDLMLERLADYYQQKNSDLTDSLSQKIEPLMMSVLAIIIGGLVIAMYLPVFQLGSVIH